MSLLAITILISGVDDLILLGGAKSRTLCTHAPFQPELIYLLSFLCISSRSCRALSGEGHIEVTFTGTASSFGKL